MNIDAIVTQLDTQVSRSASDAQTIITSSDINNDPQAMLRSQYDLQQYSVMIGYESSVMKSIKDMMMGIISKIG
ncbi:type III secretion system needle filament subunit SctF [Salmonella enterica]|nr:EscF/YscF/HrpA family type III secretion system needle major subunit [Salmonella enterica subsp. enterica serovar Sandiego]EEC0251390.1 EscF/YscF/HrpA family type III secretion system needle major subunit [Salmonella enterica subsp. enterica]EJW2128702.1 type III secretion system needle filament subunit SctF [Salmonella enterica]EEE4266585.1 EscF/YscF/HrpA family type III secretion system needle major subunit [Salmonella enterica subsp. enterica serovar Sandiego]EKT1704594.1 type III secreti